ncbi:hypothetical protein [Mucilaginibacter sp. KACC 22063]|uniref:hypothetical protein n=1 Tax=Mucilaginibacter sp. KACC 22063 TaxID=3025666 RepID=UPI00236592DF|nr:hypothetical protein [Mucilaginibacter sp. KACC 22063]WDF54990.1 hypothetical protein PQ461_18845 [Mucilaginibacter sp. KACC 22063]
MMKTLKYIGFAGILTFSLSACDQKRNSATLGGSQDTTNVSAGSDAGAVNTADKADTSNNGNKNRGKDSTSNGNANPTGHIENDTVPKAKNPHP